MTWQPEVDEIKRRTELAKQMGGAENVERQHKSGKLTVRERIDRLVDPGSFHEIGALAGKAVYENGQMISFTPSNYVVGTARIEGRRVIVGGDDFTVRGGAADARIGDKAGYGELMARELRLPIIRLVDGTGGGGSVKTIEMTGRTYVPANPAWDTVVALMSEVPVVGACMGSVAGLGAVSFDADAVREPGPERNLGHDKVACAELAVFHVRPLGQAAVAHEPGPDLGGAPGRRG